MATDTQPGIVKAVPEAHEPGRWSSSWWAIGGFAVILLLTLGWKLIADPTLTAPTRDPAWYTWRANVILEDDPGRWPASGVPGPVLGRLPHQRATSRSLAPAGGRCRRLHVQRFPHGGNHRPDRTRPGCGCVPEPTRWARHACSRCSRGGTLPHHALRGLLGQHHHPVPAVDRVGVRRRPRGDSWGARGCHVPGGAWRLPSRIRRRACCSGRR